MHRQLMSLQHHLLWQMVATALEQEARKTSHVSNFTYSLAEKALEAIASPSSSLQLSALRALVLEHLTLCRLVVSSAVYKCQIPLQMYILQIYIPSHSGCLMQASLSTLGHTSSPCMRSLFSPSSGNGSDTSTSGTAFMPASMSRWG